MTHAIKAVQTQAHCSVGDIVYQNYGPSFNEVMFFKVVGVLENVMATIVEIGCRKEYDDVKCGRAYPIVNSIVGKPSCVKIVDNQEYYYLDDGYLHAYPHKNGQGEYFFDA